MTASTHQEICAIRRRRGASVLLFLTDRCPVGCAHCSVDSRPDSPRITDFVLLESLVDRLAAMPELTMVGISGGEPFVERRGLTLAVRRLADAGKRVVIYTSGFWAASPRAPEWIDRLLPLTAAIYLSTDAHHVDGQGPERFVNAARVVARHSVPIVVQCVDEGDSLAATRASLTEALGPHWSRQAELIPTHGLPHGRGAALYAWQQRTPGRDFGPCDVVDATVVRYDGRVTACCNESVIMGAGPAALRRDAADGTEVEAAVREFHDDDFFRALGAVGPGVLTGLPQYRDLADREFSSICGLCWTMTKRRSGESRHDALLAALAGLTD
ncbi:radical SAM protein [Streptomyces sp. NPDC059002]|uniref:radical SAM protein n=1 Tax=Streptomyces sp. NPDC059002 TaxID=3346690 RepID=UPI0036B4F98F